MTQARSKQPKLKLMLAPDVLLELFSAGPDLENVKLLLVMLRVREFDGWMTAESAASVMDFLRKQGMSSADLMGSFADIRELLHIAPVGECEYDQALREWERPEDSFEALLVEAASVSVGADCIIAENPGPYEGRGRKVLTPAALFALLKERYDLNYALIEMQE